jgi:hypothetical protein
MNSENIVDISKITHDINNNKYTDDFNKKYIAEEYNDKLEDIKNNQETFYVYVTGIADWGNKLDETKKDNVFYAWIRNNFRDHIISLIPTRFTKIKIRYYDPLNDTWTKEGIKDYIEYLDCLLSGLLRIYQLIMFCLPALFCFVRIELKLTYQLIAIPQRLLLIFYRITLYFLEGNFRI